MDDGDRLLAIKEKMREYRNDPVLFVREIIGVEPTVQQAHLLNAIKAPGAKVAVRSGHGTGKSTALAWAALWFLSFFDKCRIPCTAPTGHQLSDVLWSEISRWHGQMHPLFKDNILVQKDSIRIKGAEKTRFGVARTARRENPDALQGFHAPNMLFIIDEASGIDDKIFEVARGALSTPESRVLMAANPTKITGYFYNAFHRNSRNWVNLHFSCLDSPIVGEDYIKEMLEEYGDHSDIYKVRVLGDFPSASITQLISADLADSVLGRHLLEHQYNFAPKILGVDPAWEGDDRSVIFFRQGLCAKPLGIWYDIDNVDLASKVLRFEDEYRTDATFIDVGWGTGVIDQLRHLGREPIPVNFGSRAMHHERYLNARTEMWCLMKKWMEDGGSLPDMPDLREDLVGVQYGINETNGKIMLERKKDMKSRGLKSPDLGDALAITFYRPVFPNSHSEHGTIMMAQTSYELKY